MIFDFLRRKSGNGSIVTSAQLAALLGRGSRSAAGVDVSIERAMRFGAFAACVRVLAESVGQLPLHVYEREGLDRTKAEGHSLYPLLHDAPNDNMTAQEYGEFNTACLSVRGNSMSQIVRRHSAGSVIELKPFQPDTIAPKRRGAEVIWELRLEDGKLEELPAREVFHLKLFSFGGLMGLSPLSFAREGLGMGIASEQHGAGLMANGASPRMVFKTEKGLSNTARDNITKSITEQHEGSDKHGKTMLLEEGLTPVPLTMLSTDAQWLEGRKFTRSEIAGVMRVPLHMINDLERATFSNVEQLSLDYVVHGLMPYLIRMEQRAALQLLLPKERRELTIKYNVRGLLRGDMAARAAFYQVLIQAGAISPNEIRTLEEMNQRDGGDIWLTPANLLIDGKLPAALTPAPKPAA